MYIFQQYRIAFNCQRIDHNLPVSYLTQFLKGKISQHATAGFMTNIVFYNYASFNIYKDPVYL